MRAILHIDFNSYFATVEQQANPRLRGKPIGVTGGDRLERTVIGAASVEAKLCGVKTGMAIWEAEKVCPEIILVQGDSSKYLECTKRFLNILKSYSDKLEVFSIDECFLEINSVARGPVSFAVSIAIDIKERIRAEIGQWISCSIGISYNKTMAKLAGSLFKPNGLVVIEDEEAAQFVLDRVNLDDICGIGFRIKKRLNNMGVFDFKGLRQVPLENLLASFKSYGQILYNMARGQDNSKIIPFFEKAEVKSVGHRYTLSQDTNDPEKIKQTLLKLAELVAKRLRSKKLVGKTVTFWARYTFEVGFGMQKSINYTADGLEIFKTGWEIFNQNWDKRNIRMIGISVSNLKPQNPKNLSLLPETYRQERIVKTMDLINDKYGEFTLQRGILLQSAKIKDKPNSFLSDQRFRLNFTA